MAVILVSPDAGNGTTEDDRASTNCGATARVLFSPDDATAKLATANARVAELEAQLRIRDEQLRIRDEAGRRLRDENAFYKEWAGVSPASYTEGRNVRIMQSNLQDLTTSEPDKPQGRMWPERLRNVVNTILLYKPDVVAVEEVKAGDNGRAAFDQIVQRLGPHGYTGDCCSGSVNPGARGKSECVGLIWRTTGDIGLPVDKDAVIFNLLVDVNAPPPRREDTMVRVGDPFEENTVAAAARRLELDEHGTVEACAEAFCDELPKNSSKRDSGFDRHLVLATLQTKLGQPLHVLIGHLDTGNEGNTAEVNFLKELASRAWDAGAWLVVTVDSNTDMAKNSEIWDVADNFKTVSTRVLPHWLHTNMFPFMAGIKKDTAAPQRNDEIFFPSSWELVSAGTALMCPDAGAAWARVSATLNAAPTQRLKPEKRVELRNQQLTYRISDHLAVIGEAKLPLSRRGNNYRRRRSSSLSW